MGDDGGSGRPAEIIPETQRKAGSRLGPAFCRWWSAISKYQNSQAHSVIPEDVFRHQHCLIPVANLWVAPEYLLSQTGRGEPGQPSSVFRHSQATTLSWPPLGDFNMTSSHSHSIITPTWHCRCPCVHMPPIAVCPKAKAAIKKLVARIKRIPATASPSFL